MSTQRLIQSKIDQTRDDHWLHIQENEQHFNDRKKADKRKSTRSK